jgi:hypothetical protein
MANTKCPLFTLAEERTHSSGLKTQIYDGIGYRLVARQYPGDFTYYNVTGDPDTSRFLPPIYFRTDSEERPVCATIGTVSYGSLTIAEHAELQRAMALAQAHAEEIETRFIKGEEAAHG